MASADDFTAAGVSVRRPTARAAHESDRTTAFTTLRLRVSGDAAGEPVASDDAETLGVFQELAFQYAMEQARSAVRTILLNANKKRYSEAHIFLQHYMTRIPGQLGEGGGIPKVVAFPPLMKMPAVAIVSGSDATFSDVWMTPLCQVINRSFPMILVVRDNIPDVRRLLEWVVERLDEYSSMKKRDEAWLIEQIEARSALAQRFQSGKEPLADAALVLRQQRRLRNRPQRSTPPPQASGERPTRYDGSDEEFTVFGDSDTSSDSEDADGEPVRKNVGAKRKRRSKARKLGMKYSELLLADLLVKLRHKLRVLGRLKDPTVTWTDALRDVVLEDLRERLARAQGVVDTSIKVYDEVLEWIKRQIVNYRQLPSLPHSVRVVTAEFALATLMNRVLLDFLGWLNSVKPDSKLEIDAVQVKSRQIELVLLRHADAYNLHHFAASQHDQVSRHLDPYLLMCVEHLDGINLQVLRDFVDVWGHFTNQHPETSSHMRLGFIFGVTTTTSQLLRRLGLSLVRRLDVQFIPLEDSKTRSEDILEALFVDNHFPLCLRGDTLRLLDNRHLTSQSLTAFMQALEYVAFNHFLETPWSFLSHLALEAHRLKPLHSVASGSTLLRRWMQRSGFRGRTLRDYLSRFSSGGVQNLLRKMKSPSATEDGIALLDHELSHFCDRRLRWIAGWKCFRSACAWFNLDFDGEPFVHCLSTALDGQLARSKKVESITLMLEVQSFEVIMHILKDWRAALVTLTDRALVSDINDLLLLMEHVLDTRQDKETVAMQHLFRQEIGRFFRDRLLPMMKLDKPASGSARSLVSSWTIVSTSSLKTAAHLVLSIHEDLINSLSSQDDETYGGSTAVADVSLAFMYYREHAGLQLNVGDWFDAFADAVREEVGEKAAAIVADSIDADELNARFARALATLRLWGYIKGPDGVRGTIRRLQDVKVEKRIFI